MPKAWGSISLCLEATRKAWECVSPDPLLGPTPNPWNSVSLVGWGHAKGVEMPIPQLKATPTACESVSRTRGSTIKAWESASPT